MEIFQFIGIVQGLIAPNRFKVQFTVPGIGFELLKIPFLCHTSGIPYPTFSEGKTFYNNYDHKYATKEDYDPITMTFYLDVGNNVLEFLERWKNLIINENKQLGFKKDYAGEAHVILYDGYLIKKIDAVIHNIYPTNINQLELSWNTKDTIAEISVDFNYDRIVYNLAGSKTKESLEDQLAKVKTGQIP